MKNYDQESNLKNRKRKFFENQDSVIYVRVCVCVKVKNLCVYQDV